MEQKFAEILSSEIDEILKTVLDGISMYDRKNHRWRINIKAILVMCIQHCIKWANKERLVTF